MQQRAKRAEAAADTAKQSAQQAEQRATVDSLARQQLRKSRHLCQNNQYILWIQIGACCGRVRLKCRSVLELQVAVAELHEREARLAAEQAAAEHDVTVAIRERDAAIARLHVSHSCAELVVSAPGCNSGFAISHAIAVQFPCALHLL